MPAIIPIIGAAATIGGAAIASGGAKSAANTQAAEQQAALDQQQSQFNTTQANQAPWLAAGKTALQHQLDLLGIGGSAGTPGTPASYGFGGGQGSGVAGGFGGYGYSPGTPGTPGISATDAQSQAIQQLQQSPLYQSLFRNGQETLLNNAAATGGLRGGNTAHSLANFGADTLSQVIQQQLTNLAGVSGTGSATATNLGNQSQANANAQSNQLNAIGSSQAGGILGSTGIWNNAFNQVGGQLGRIFQGNNASVQSLYGNAANTIDGNNQYGTSIF